MSGSLLAERGLSRTLDGHVTGCVFDQSGAAAFATGEGTLHIRTTTDWTDIAAHDGAILSLARDVTAGSFLTGGDDGVLARIGRETIPIARFGNKWVESVASHADGLIAAAAGRQVGVFDAEGQRLKTLEHPSTVTGVTFDAKGKRVGASHYNGASLWFVAAKTDNARKLEWKGSHIGLAIHPQGEALVTAMQENALHGWRLSDGHHMKMSGYPQKTLSLSFTRNGRWLATSGADAIVLWPFFGGGPMGKPPMELAAGAGAVCTRLACHPQQDMVAAGFADGSVLIADIGTERLLPVCGAGGGQISSIAWSATGAALAFGSEDGRACVVDLSKRS